MPRRPTWTPTAASIAELVDAEGLDKLRWRLGITARQAAQLELAARRALRDGYELGPLEVLSGTVAAHAANQARGRPGAPLTAEQVETAALFARLEPHAPTTDERYAEQDAARRQLIYRRNVKGGYDEWRPLLEDDGR